MGLDDLKCPVVDGLLRRRPVIRTGITAGGPKVDARVAAA